MNRFKQPVPCSFWWMGEWHNGLIIRWSGIELESEQSMYEVKGDGFNLPYLPKRCIIPKIHIEL